MPSTDKQAARRIGEIEILLLALALVAAHHAIPFTLMYKVLPAQVLYERLGWNSFVMLQDGLQAILPLLLCLGVPLRSGLRLGTWRRRTWRVIGVCALPPALTAIIYPLTSQPFTGGSIGGWLTSPAAQDLLFSGYLYGLLDMTFPGPISKRIPVNKAVLMTAVFFSLWHVPNLLDIAPQYVVFQLLYTFVGGAWTLLARQCTGSMLPGLASHMAVNFIAWKGW